MNSDEKTPSQLRQPHSVNYYKRILMQGNGTQWRALVQDIKANYDIAYRVAEACSQLKPEYKTIQTLWKTAIETSQPTIKINLDPNDLNDMKVRNLKRTKYSE